MILAACIGPGFQVHTAVDGQEGLARARALRPAVVVSDVMMPELDGVSMTRAMRSDPHLREVPVILVTAKTGQADRTAAAELADVWLSKPFHGPELRAHVQRLCLASRAPAPASGSGALAPAAPKRPAADQALLDRLGALLHAQLSDEGLTVDGLARSAGMAERTLQRELARVEGVSPSTWIREQRLGAARQMLEEGRFKTVGEVAAAVGMSRGYFTRAYRAWSGSAPTEHLNGSAAAPTPGARE